MLKTMIPKTIHYCWFGRNPLPSSAKRCINSWKKYLPEYEIKEWNEDNFYVNSIPYTRDAYAAKKYAFVSDYARFWVLYHYGGVYFDTDVEVIRPMDDIIERGAFMGWETANNEGIQKVAPGLCLGAPKGLPIYKEILSEFERLSFYLEDGQYNPYTMIPLVTDILLKNGMKNDGSTQSVADITIYATDYFCPMDALTGKVTKTKNTRSIHWYTMSWLDKKRQRKAKLTRPLRRLFGTKFINRISKLLYNSLEKSK